MQNVCSCSVMIAVKELAEKQQEGRKGRGDIQVQVFTCDW